MSSRFLLHGSWRGCNQSQLSCIRIKRYNNLVLLIVIQYFKINKCRFKLKLDRKMVNVFSFLTANFSSNIHRWDTLFWQYSPVENYILCYGLHLYFNCTAWGFNMIHSNSWVIWFLQVCLKTNLEHLLVQRLMVAREHIFIWDGKT